MKTLREAVGDSLALRRGLGFKLKKHQRFLEEFASFLEQESTSQITSRLALCFGQHAPSTYEPSEWAARLGVVRGFARYWSATDATTELPPDGLLPYRPRRAKPYLYSEEQILQLLEAAKNMPTTHSLQPWTYHCLLGLLAVTGLRISEVLNLRAQTSTGRKVCSRSATPSSESLDWFLSTLRASKVLSDYAVRRNHLFTSRNSGYFFLSRRGARLDEGQVRRTFYTLSRQIGIRGVLASRGPRLHDFRHRFAVQTLLHWHRAGEDVRRRLPVLSTYLGHAHVTDTYWYVSSTPELMEAVAERLENVGRLIDERCNELSRSPRVIFHKTSDCSA